MSFQVEDSLLVESGSSEKIVVPEVMDWLDTPRMLQVRGVAQLS